MAGPENISNMDVAALLKFLTESASSAPSQYAFVRRGKVLCFFADVDVALESGARSFPDHEFSVIDVAAGRVILLH